MTVPQVSNNMQMIEHVHAQLSGLRILDIGCGSGRLLRALARRGAIVTGVEPSAELAARARQTEPSAQVLKGVAEALPLPDASQDGAIILNSLHHIPETAIRPALTEALRVLRPGATLLIMEPLARGGYQEVFAPIDDETEIRAMALRELDRFLRETAAREVLRVEYDTQVKERDAETMLDYARAIDPARAQRIALHGEEVRRRFARHAKPVEGGFLIDQPMIAIGIVDGAAR